MALAITLCIPYFHEPFVRWAFVPVQPLDSDTYIPSTNTTSNSVKAWTHVHLSKAFMATGTLVLLALKLIIPLITLRIRIRREGLHVLDGR